MEGLREPLTGFSTVIEKSFISCFYANPDRDRTSLSEDYEVRYRANKFGVSRDQLKKVVRQVGDNPKKVEEYLNAGK